MKISYTNLFRTPIYSESTCFFLGALSDIRLSGQPDIRHNPIYSLSFQNRRAFSWALYRICLRCALSPSTQGWLSSWTLSCRYKKNNQCCGSVSFLYGSGSRSKSDLKSRKYQLLFDFFFLKKIFLLNMSCFIIYGVNIYVSKNKFNSF